LIAVIKQAVEESGLSLNELSKRSGVSRPQLSRFMSGQRGLNLDSAAKLFEFFGFRAVRDMPLSSPPEPPPSPPKAKRRPRPS
jgi:transcriptional regulator with XRE-family HTH domain